MLKCRQPLRHQSLSNCHERRMGNSRMGFLFVTIILAKCPTTLAQKECKPWCSSNQDKWVKKCAWETFCDACPQCFVPMLDTASTGISTQKSKVSAGGRCDWLWCASHENDWQRKCKWKRCIACSECTGQEHTDTTTTAIMGTRSKATTESTTKSVYTGTIPNVGIATTTLTATVDITSTADTGTSTAIISVPKTKSNSIINTILTTTLATKIVSSESILVTTASLSTEHSCAGKSNKRPLQQCKHVLISGLCNDFADQCESSCNGCDTTLPIATANSVVTTGPINDITIPAATTDNRMPTETNKMLTAFDKTSFDSTSNAVASTLSVQARATLTVTIDSDKSTTTFAAEDIDLKAFLQSNYQSKNLQGTVNILTITTIMSVVILVIAISSVIVAALVVKHKMQKTKKQASRQVNDVEKNNVADRTTQKQRSPNMAGLDSHTLDTHSHPKNGGVTNCELKDIVIETNNRMINSSDTTTTKKFDDVISVMESKRIWK